MKRVFFVVLVVLVLFGSVRGYGEERLIMSLTANFLAPSDSNFKDIYGSGVFLPEFKTGYKLFKSMYVWVGYGSLTATGETPVLKREAEVNHQFLSGGVGYASKLKGKFGYNVDLGFFNVSYKEKSMGIEYIGSASGLRFDGGVHYQLTKNLYGQLTLGYLSAKDEIEGVDITLGGFKAGVGVWIQI